MNRPLNGTMPSGRNSRLRAITVSVCGSNRALTRWPKKVTRASPGRDTPEAFATESIAARFDSSTDRSDSQLSLASSRVTRASSGTKRSSTSGVRIRSARSFWVSEPNPPGGRVAPAPVPT